MDSEKIEWDYNQSNSNMMLIETAKFHDMTLKVSYEEGDDFNPRKEHDNIGEMLCWHPRYELGDEQFSGPEDVGGARSMQEVCDWLIHQRGAVVLLPLFLYDHSGLSISAGPVIRTESATSDDVRASGRFLGDDAGWDTSAVGFIYATHKSLDENYRDYGADPWAPIEVEEQLGSFDSALGRWIPKKVTKPTVVVALEAEVKEYDSYLRNEVYWYRIEGPDGETLDSCGGFIGDIEYVKAEAESAARATWDARFPVPNGAERVGV